MPDHKQTSACQVAELRARGEAALAREAAVFEAEMGRKGGQDARWLQQVRQSGTMSDKVAAITLLLQVSPTAWPCRLQQGYARGKLATPQLS
jgi:hypothetical protein